MGHITSYLVGGFAAVASWSMVAPPDSTGGIPTLAAAFQSRDPAVAKEPTAQENVNRAAKGDRLAEPRPGDAYTVTSIEVVGVHDAAIIYRDRDGRVLYRTDPLNNVTMIAKGAKLPEVTVRRDAGSKARPVPIQVPDKSTDTKPTPMPVGCEPSVSPIVSPKLSHLTGRCISQRDEPVMVAAAN